MKNQTTFPHTLLLITTAKLKLVFSALVTVLPTAIKANNEYSFLQAPYVFIFMLLPIWKSTLKTKVSLTIHL